MPGKRHLKSRERGDRKGANGGKREGERSEQESVVPRPPEREVHGEKTTERATRSKVVVFPSFPESGG